MTCKMTCTLAMYACVCYYEYMKRTAFFLRDDQLQKLASRSAETGAPVAELIRRAIDAYLKKGK